MRAHFPAKFILSVCTVVTLLLPAGVTSAQVVPVPAPGAAPISASLMAKVTETVDADTERLTSIFKDLHANPELGFTEKRTAGVMAKELRALGFTVTEGIGKTGVVGVFRNGPGPTVWFRADMDANAVREATNLPYASKNKQRLEDGSEVDVMHSCGHDAHVTWALGLAKTLVDLRSDWSGTLVVYGQPAEELGLGAQAMVADGLWKRDFPKPDYAFGAHAAPGPIGYLSSSPGTRMAGFDQIDVTFYGVGGHGSQPHLAIDPVVMAAQAVLAYQTIVSRSLDPQAAAVVTVGAVLAGRDNNVIPASAEVRLNTRWFTQEVRQQLIRRIDEISRGVAEAAGMPADKMPKRVMKGYANTLVNDPSLVARVNPSLEALMGKDRVIDKFPTVMGSEDFQEAFTELSTPLSFMLVGVAPAEMYFKAMAAGRSQPYSNHNPDFFVDLAAIPIGTKANSVAVLSILAKR